MKQYLIAIILLAGILIGAGVSAQTGFNPVKKQIPLPINKANETIILNGYNLSSINVKADYYIMEGNRVEVCLNGELFNNACNQYDNLEQAKGFLKERLEAIADAAKKRQNPETKYLTVTEELGNYEPQEG